MDNMDNMDNPIIPAIARKKALRENAYGEILRPHTAPYITEVENGTGPYPSCEELRCLPPSIVLCYWAWLQLVKKVRGFYEENSEFLWVLRRLHHSTKSFDLITGRSLPIPDLVYRQNPVGLMRGLKEQLELDDPNAMLLWLALQLDYIHWSFHHENNYRFRYEVTDLEAVRRRLFGARDSLRAHLLQYQQSTAAQKGTFDQEKVSRASKWIETFTRKTHRINNAIFILVQMHVAANMNYWPTVMMVADPEGLKDCWENIRYHQCEKTPRTEVTYKYSKEDDKDIVDGEAFDFTGLETLEKNLRELSQEQAWVCLRDEITYDRDEMCKLQHRYCACSCKR